MFFNSVKKGDNSPIQYITTIVLVFMGYAFGYVNLYSIIWIKMQYDNSIGTDALNEFSKNPDFTILNINQNIGFLILLSIFVFALAGLYLGITFVHKRNFKSLFAFNERIDWRRYFWSTSVWFLILITIEVISFLINPDNYTFQKPTFQFIFLIIISLVILPLQTSFEELFIRGYIFQSIGYNTKNIYIGFIFSIVIFAFMHSGNPEISNYGYFKMMSYYIVAGLILGLLIIYDDRIELAIGVHSATNMFGAVMLTYEGAAIQTASLFKTKEVDPLLLSFQFLIAGIFFIFLASKKYNWKLITKANFYKKLNSNEFKNSDTV
ncbi:MAG: lysostaphin resistance A-like protein [Saprospiraceae bacterium]